MKKAFLDNLMQIFLIVFSVVLGLYLSERLEERKTKKEASQLLAKIKQELRSNKKLLDYWTPYHKKVTHTLDSLSKNDSFVAKFVEDRNIFYSAFTEGTLMRESPSQESWEIAKAHPLIVNFDYDELLVLTRIYNQQKSTFESVPKLVDLIMAKDLNAEGQARANLQVIKERLGDIASRETSLINYYNQAEKILGYEEATAE